MKLFDVNEKENLLSQKTYDDGGIPLHVVKFGSVHQPFFKQMDSALVIKDMIYLKDD